MKVSKFFLKLSPLAILFAGMSSAMAEDASQWAGMAEGNIAGQSGLPSGMNLSGVTDLTTSDETMSSGETVRDETVKQGGIDVISDSESGYRRGMEKEGRDIGLNGSDVDVDEGKESNIQNRRKVQGVVSARDAAKYRMSLAQEGGA